MLTYNKAFGSIVNYVLDRPQNECVLFGKFDPFRSSCLIGKLFCDRGLHLCRGLNYYTLFSTLDALVS